MPVLRRTSSTTHARAALDGGVRIYWRPGCPLCAKLRSALRPHGDRITWVDVREDPEAAAFVRTTNPGGHELVPVAVIAGVAHPRPTVRLVLAALR